jgi:hypothetical protein
MSSESDYKYFIDNLKSLYKQYGGRFLVIKDGAVIGSYTTFSDAFYATAKTEKLGTFIIQECVDDPEKLVQHFQSNVAFA